MNILWPRILGLLLTLTILSGCVKTYQIKVNPGSEELPIEAVAILPCRFGWEEPAYRSYEISQILALQSLDVGLYSVFGPGEISIPRPSQDSNSLVGIDLTLGLANQGLSSASALLVRPSLERQVKTELRQVFDLQGNPKGTARGDEMAIVAQLEIYHAATMRMIASASAKTIVNEKNNIGSTDPLPEVTATMSQMLKDLLEQISFRAPGEAITRKAGFEYIWNPKAVLDFSYAGKPALADSLPTLDPLERDLAIMTRLQFFLPSADSTVLSTLRNLPAGLLVTAVADPTKSSVKVGDLIIQINEQPATPQSLDRALRAAGPGGKPMYFKLHRP